MRTEPPTAVVFNGILADTGDYRWPPITQAGFAAQIRRGEADRPFARAPMAHLKASRLSEAGWGVVFSNGLDPAVREALLPLLRRRQEQAGGLYRELAYYGGSWLQFLADHDAGPGMADPRKVPYYLLMVGDPQQIPFELQYLLGTSYAVGRLSFETPEEYASYVRGVLAVEERRVERPRRVDLFGVRNEGDLNTAASERYLIDGLATALDGQNGWSVRPFRRDQASKAQLRQLLGGEESSSILLTASHAICFWPDDPLQASDQGGLLCNDWPGPGKWQGRVPREHYFSAHDLGEQADPRGMIAFHFACFSSGTPRLDAFSRASGEAIPVNAPADFLAALPRRLLGHPSGGALAVIGHVDQAWPSSFEWRNLDSPQIAHFESAFRELMAGKPVGLALESFRERYTALATALTQIREQRRETGEEPSPEEAEFEAYLWQAHNDSRSYLLLGDPAVRLPGAEETETGQ